MFSNINKPAFGSSAATPSFGFGSSSTTNQTPFGQSQLFGKTNTTGFGSSAPLFGSTSQQPTAPLFTNTAVPSFGAAPQQTGFGTAGLFGQQQNVTGGNGLFTGASTSTFGQQNKTAGFGFGASTATPLFGQQQTQNFQPSTSAGVFGSSAGFGTTQQMGTVIKFNPVTGTDTMQKSGITHSISTKHHCITCMKEYEAKSLEELRWEDYQCNRRGPQQQGGFGTTPFGAPASTAPSLFGQTETKPAFGQTSGFGPSTSGFGMTNPPNQSTLFGKATSGFGATPTTNTFGFNTTPAFGANATKPFGAQPTQNVFGATANTTQPTAFGNNFFAQTSTQNTGGFFSKPTQTAFSTQQPVFTFGQQPTNQTNFFQPPKSTAGFGSFGQTNLTTSAGFGQPSNIFSQSTQNPFNAFQKPAQPPFGQPLQPGFGLGTQPGTNSFFGANKPLFGATTQSSFFTPPSGGFMMPQQQQPIQNPSSGLDLQQAQDFQTHVEQIYEPFPHYEFLADIAAKPKPVDATNPQAIKEILDQAPMPVTVIDKNISKFRIMAKPRYLLGGAKYALLNDVVDRPTSYNNNLGRYSTGKRLVIRKTAPRTDKELLEEYKRMASPESSKNRSLFRNVHQLDETDSKNVNIMYANDSFQHSSNQGISLNNVSGELGSKGFRFKTNGPVFHTADFRSRSSVDLKTEGTQTNDAEDSQKLNQNKVPLIDLGTDSESESKDDENSERSSLNNISPVAENARSSSNIGLSDADITLGSPSKYENNTGPSPRSVGKKNKSVRFQDSEVSSTSDLETDTAVSRSSSSKTDNKQEPIRGTKDVSSHRSDEVDKETVENRSAAERYVKSCGVKLERPEYYTIPPLDELYKYKKDNGACIIKGFTIGRVGYGNIYFPDAMDVSNLNLDEILHFRYREITVYPDDDDKPPVGQGLNRRAQVTLEHVFPRDRRTREIVRDIKEIAASNFTDRLCLLAEKQSASFLDYRPDTGSWVFTVDHFSKYKFSEADDAECSDYLERRQQELKQKELEKKKLEEQEGKMEPLKRGLGGVMPSQTMESPRELPLSRPPTQPQTMSHFKEDRNVIIMKSSFFDEESISDDVSSSDVGIAQHFTLPTTSVTGILSSRIVAHRGKAKPRTVKYFAIRNYRREVPLYRSLIMSRNFMDAAVFKGRSFKVGWGRGFNFTTITSVVKDDPHIINSLSEPCCPDVVVYLDLGNLCGKRQVMELKEHLRIVYENCTVSVDGSGIPLFKINEGTDALVRHLQASNNLNNLCEDSTIAYYKEVWDLCFALWGPEATSPTARRELFSKWLEETAFAQICNQIEFCFFKDKTVIKNLFLYLTAHQIFRASRLAIDKDLPRLSALITQTQETTKMFVRHQIEFWKQTGTLNFIDRDLVKLYMLAGGVPVINDINVCEDLDWKRALAIHLWYMCPQGTSLINAVQAYKQSFTTLCYAKEPIPDHCQSNPLYDVHDLLYNIMSLFCAPNTSLEKLLNTLTYTKDALDYRLSWMLLQTFQALKLGIIRDQSVDSLHIRFASQLEHMGLWNWSIFVLIFIKDNSLKMKEVMAVLERNLDPDRTSEEYLRMEDMLVTHFKVPPAWIHNVLGDKTKHFDQPVDCLKHLILAKDWRKAHSLAVSQIIPEFVASGQCEKLSSLLAHLIPGKHDIALWKNGVGLIIDFLKLKQKVEELKSSIAQRNAAEGGKVAEEDLIKMKSELISLCHRIKQFPICNAEQSLAIAEVSKFLAMLLYLIYCKLQPTGSGNINTAMALLKELIMPPDYKTIELRKYVHQYVRLN